MARYKIWNHTDPIYTHVGEVLSPEEWLARYPWARQPGAVLVVADDLINGGFCGELHAMKKLCEQAGAQFADDLSDAALLDAIEAFELAAAQNDTPSSEERIAAALEAQVMLSLPDAAVPAAASYARRNADDPLRAPAAQRVQRTYARGLWPAQLVQLAAAKGVISSDACARILEG